MNLIVLSHMYPNRSFSNSGIFVQEQVNALRKKIDGDITVISPVPWAPKILWFRDKWKKYGQVEKQRAEGRVNCCFPRFFCLPGGLFFPLQGFFVYLSARRLIKRLINGPNGQTVLHAHMVLPDGLAAILLKKKFQLPVVCTAHGSDVNIYPFANPLNMRLTRLVLVGVDAVAAVSNNLKEAIEKLTGAVKDASVIHNGVDLNKFKPISKEHAKEVLGVAPNDKIVLFTGNLIKLKCVDILIKAFCRLKKNLPQERLKLFLIGDGPQKNNLASLARILKLEDDVIFLGEKPHEEIPRWLNLADVFVLPSASEGFPTIIVEAMACGVPIVATNIGGVPEAISDGNTGILTAPNDVDSMIKAIARCIMDEEFVGSIKKQAIEKAKEFNWDTNAGAYTNLYEKSLHNNNGS